jgi:uncharacterized protein
LDARRVNRITSMLLEEMRTLTDEGRDLPIRWNIMHMYSSSQIAKVLALRRGMGEQAAELASIAAALHDIAVVATKKHDRHAEVAGEYVRDAIAKYNNGLWNIFPR